MFSRLVIYNFADVCKEIISNQRYYEEGKKLLDSLKSEVTNSLFKAIDSTQSIIDAQDIENIWFPRIECNIFISHSHKDIESIISFVGWLYAKYGIVSFVDDGIWENYNDLRIKLFNKIFQDFEDDLMTQDEIEKIAYSNSLLILNSAIEKMIDSTECFLFIGTDNSLLTGDTHTKSPWIYSEVLFSNMVRRKRLLCYRQHIEHGFSQKMCETVEVKFKCSFINFTEITRQDFLKFKSYSPAVIIADESLDTLYKILEKRILVESKTDFL